ncbi:hypothetical protein GCM10007338_01790 [Corynebacterium pelargi]|nr:hypothetical protein GCM10007338_01790 [Corynebacterium pelargi]
MKTQGPKDPPKCWCEFEVTASYPAWHEHGQDRVEGKPGNPGHKVGRILHCPPHPNNDGGGQRRMIWQTLLLDIPRT